MTEEEQPELKWIEAKEIGIEGQGWTDTECPYDRFPKKAEALLTNPQVWNLSKSPTGMCVHFRTDAKQITVRWELLSPKYVEENFTKAGYSGFDLYGKDGKGEWRWVDCTRFFDQCPTPMKAIAEGLDGKMREYRMYMPSRDRLQRVEIGVPVESSFEGIAPRTTRPVVIYGTSIVHGAYATRSGMIYTAHLSRRIDRPFINLGFSGSARMEPEIADLLLELDAEVYLLDAFPNMNLERVEERLENFLRKLAAGKPEVPIVVVEDFPRTNFWIMPEKEDVPKKNERVREIVKGLQAEGLKLFTVKGDDLLGTDHEGTADGIHPNDLGYYRMFEKILPVLQQALEART